MESRAELGESNHTLPSVKKMRKKIAELMPPNMPRKEDLTTKEARFPMKAVVHDTTEG